VALLGSWGGGGSITRWLAQRVGPTGHVLVTDIDPRFLTELVTPTHLNIEVQRHDIVLDPLPEKMFDLIHARLVLVHLLERLRALERMVAALRPGGWIVIEDFDFQLLDRTYPLEDGTSATLFRKRNEAMDSLLAARGVHLTWGRRLYQLFCEHGLVDVEMEGHLAIRRGSTPSAAIDRANLDMLRTQLMSAGLLNEQEIDANLALFDDPSVIYSSPVMMSARGRRPL
jgi:SAM-dependent methyltransferase